VASSCDCCRCKPPPCARTVPCPALLCSACWHGLAGAPTLPSDVGVLSQGKMRIGLQEQSVLVALAHSACLQREGVMDKGPRLADQLELAAVAVKTAYSECPSYEVVGGWGPEE